MSLFDEFCRVSKALPCPICGKCKGCLVSKDNPSDPCYVICVRVPSERQCGGAGWLHVLRHPFERLRRSVEQRRIATVRTGQEPSKRFQELMVIYRNNVQKRPKSMARLARQLGVSVEALRALGIGWSKRHGSWAFPMLDDRDHVIGVSLRRPDGTKWAVKGSALGLFIPSDIEGTGQLFLSEGATDSCALWDFGVHVIGRPGCTQAKRLIVRFVKRHRPRSVVIVADRDRPGLEGANRLAGALALHADVRIITPPKGAKDAREWIQRGLTAKKLRATIRSAPPIKITVSSKGV